MLLIPYKNLEEGERAGRGAVGDYLLPQRLAFQFYYIQRVPDTTRRQQQHETSSGFSPILSCCVCGARILFLHKRTTDQQAVAFFFFFNFLYEGNSVGTTGSFEMIREKEPSSLSLSLSTGNVFTSLRAVSRARPFASFFYGCVSCVYWGKDELRTTDEVVRAFQRRFPTAASHRMQIKNEIKKLKAKCIQKEEEDPLDLFRR